MDLETLYLEQCDHTRREPTQAKFEKFARRANHLMSSVVGTQVAVQMRDRGLARKVVVKGTVKSVEPAYLHRTARGCVVVWEVTLTSGRVVRLTKI